jgi:hypothetical protein
MYRGPYVAEQCGMPIAQSQSTSVDPEAGIYDDKDEASVIAPGSVTDSNGRTYQGYREGKYFLPNDPVFAPTRFLYGAPLKDELTLTTDGTRPP